ncbi:MAG: sugar transferase [Acidobacteriaceae bacterium]
MKMTALATIFIAIVARLMADEVKAWSGWLHKKMRRRAVAKLPAQCRERYDEEWESGLEETPGEIFKVIYSMGLFRAAYRIRGDVLKSAGESKTPFAPLKRLFDIALSSMALLLLAPLMLAIAVAVKLESRGPAFYFAERIGRKGRPFRYLKFRTMALGTEKPQAEMMPIVDRNGALFQMTNDPRVTLFGRFLRKYSMDELPQLFNVLRGDMSIVGPRPTTASEVKEYELSSLRRLDVAPGITGLWQIQSRQAPLSPSPKPLDDVYVDNWSLWLDLKILLRTIRAPFRGPGSDPGQGASDRDDQSD